MQRRLFTLEEALALLPKAARRLLEIQTAKREIDELTAELERLMGLTGGNGHLQQDIERARNRLEAAVTYAQRLIDDLTALGVELKGIDQGLLDFPSERDGRVVYLCWQQGEETIAFWHDLDAGFAGRQPL